MASNQSGSPLRLRLVPPYERFRDAHAQLSGGPAAVFNSVLVLRDAKYLLLESEQTDGTWVGSPMWFAAVNDTIFLRTEADSPNVRRMSRRLLVKVAPCTMRGKPLDDHIECMARIAPQEREAQAEAALDRAYGLLRGLINRFTNSHHVYLELTQKLPPAEIAPWLEVRTLRGDRAGPRKMRRERDLRGRVRSGCPHSEHEHERARASRATSHNSTCEKCSVSGSSGRSTCPRHWSTRSLRQALLMARVDEMRKPRALSSSRLPSQACQ